MAIDPSRFLTTLAQTLSTMGLYAPGHPARERVVDRSYALLHELVRDGRAEFSFLGDEVVHGSTPSSIRPSSTSRPPASSAEHPRVASMSPEHRKSNVRLALILASVALAFAIGFAVKIALLS
jgi:hypothetical protein